MIRKSIERFIYHFKKTVIYNYCLSCYSVQALERRLLEGWKYSVQGFRITWKKVSCSRLRCYTEHVAGVRRFFLPPSSSPSGILIFLHVVRPSDKTNCRRPTTVKLVLLPLCASSRKNVSGEFNAPTPHKSRRPERAPKTRHHRHHP